MSSYRGWRVLSIQSHVVHGYVGNKSATFPLQILGFEVDAINSVQFSNHTGYKSFKGQILQEKELAELFNGLESNGLLSLYTHLLTGYIGNVSFLKKIAEIVKKLKLINPKLVYVCDPVLGDNGKMYVPEELLPIYRDEILPLADIITPNQYEVELLFKNEIVTDLNAWSAMEWFHSKNIKTIVFSSTEMNNKNELKVFLSQKDGPKCTLNIPKQGDSINLTGTGDVFASLFLAHSTINEDIIIALEYTIATIQAIIRKTINSLSIDIQSNQKEFKAHEKELKLIQSKTDIEHPLVKLKAEIKY